MMRTSAILLVVATLAGCQGSGETTATPAVEGAADARAPHPSIDKIELQSQLAPVNLDARPGPDGVQVRLYLWRAADPLAAMLERGTIEFLMYEGRVAPTQLNAAQPLRIWSYSAGRLRGAAGKSAFGYGYTMALSWADQPPRTGMITLTARLLRPGAEPLYAEPVNLAVGSTGG